MKLPLVFLLSLLLLISRAASAEDGVTDSTILLGQTVGVSGIVAAPVREMNEGAQAYFDIVNARGGVWGRQIMLRTLDDRFDPAQTLANAEQLILRDHVFALFQGRGTPHTQGILPLLTRHGVPLLAPSTGASLFHTPVNRWVFNVRPKYQDEVVVGIKHFTTLGLTRIALLHVDDAFGLDALEGFEREMQSRKLPPAAILKFARVDPDYAATARAVLAAKPQALIIVSSAKNTVEVIKALRALDRTLPVLTLSNNSSSAFVANLGPAGAGVIISQTMPVPDLQLSPLAIEFIKVAKEKNVTLSYAALEGYVNARVMVEGLQRAGRALTRERFVQALESIHRLDIGGVLIDFGPHDHSGSAFIELTMIGRDGRLVR